MDEHTYLTVPELADLLRTPPATVYRWRLHGYGPPAVKVGKRLLYARPAVDRWLEEQAAKSGAA